MCHIISDMKITMFWDVTPCKLVERYYRFEGPRCLGIQGRGRWPWKELVRIGGGPDRTNKRKELERSQENREGCLQGYIRGIKKRKEGEGEEKV
jgi:hypothetical protein